MRNIRLGREKYIGGPLPSTCPPLPRGGAALLVTFLLALQSNPWVKAQDAKQAATPRAAVETFAERAERSGEALRLSLQDVVKIALRSNLNIAIQDFSEEISRQRMFAAQFVYEPRFAAGFGYRSDDVPNSRVYDRALAGIASNTKGLNWTWGILQNLPYGGSWRFDYANTRTATFPLNINALFADQFSGGLTFTFTQPLVRDFRDNSAFHAIKLAKLDDQISDTQFEQQVTNIVKQVQDLYWELLFAIRDQEIKKKSLDLARTQLEQNKQKVEIGTLAPIAITEAAVEIANREQAMIASENLINRMQNDLKRALSSDRDSEVWDKSIIPVENADFVPANFDLRESIAIALANRPELRQLQLGLKKVDTDYNYFKNQKRPRFDIQSTFGTSGVAGTPALPSPGIVLPPLPSELVGGIGRLTRQLFSGDFKHYSVGVQVEIPLRNRGADAQLAQLSLQRQQTLKQLKETEQMVLVDVRNALQAIETNRKVVETAQAARKLAEEQLAGENKMFEAGLSTTFFVLQRQADLSATEGRLLRALIDYRKSINDLHKAIFVTLDKNDMGIAKSQTSDARR